MGKVLSSDILSQLSSKRLKAKTVLKIDGVDLTGYLLSSNISADVNYGCNSCIIKLKNPDGIFSPGGSNELNIGDIVILSRYYDGITTEFKKFYGKIDQRNRTQSFNTKEITITCLDMVSYLKNWDVDLVIEGTKVEITDETLSPVFLTNPNEELAQIFNFANDNVATKPLPIISIYDRTNETYDTISIDEVNLLYSAGQVQLGSPINAQDNYSLVAKDYFFYSVGVSIEDCYKELLTQPDGYGRYLFGESSAQDVIDNHLTETFLNVTGMSYDTLSVDSENDTIEIRHLVEENITEGATSIVLDSVEGLPYSGEGEINGDIFTWEAIGSGNVLLGIPAVGSYSLKAHSSNSYFKYFKDTTPGQVWYFKFSKIISTITESLISGLPSGVSIEYIDYDYGRIILSTDISLSAVIKYNGDYSFSTLQASGIEINYKRFHPREVNDRYECFNQLKEYVAPNYILFTRGDDKIWSKYVTQKTTADYSLDIIESSEIMEDEDLYTRVVAYGKNINPTNFMLEDIVDFSTTGQTYKAFANLTTLVYNMDNDDVDYYSFESAISDAGYIDYDTILPKVYINSVLMDNKAHWVYSQTVTHKTTTDTVLKTGCHGTSKDTYSKQHTYYYYYIYFPHSSMSSDQPIYLYDAYGVLLYTLSANDPSVDYGKGIWQVPGTEKNETVESIATATYCINYSTSNLVIDYDNVRFKISKSILKYPGQAIIQASFEYWTVFIPIQDVASIKDGRYSTQVQMEFFAEPPTGYPLAILDLGQTRTIQALDIIAGFYKPDDYLKYDVGMKLSLQYSLDGTNYYAVSKDTENFDLTGGDSIGFGESELGMDFQARYVKLLINHCDKIEYSSIQVTVTDDNYQQLVNNGTIEEGTEIGTVCTLRSGRWVVAIAEVTAYSDIILKSEAKLIPTTSITEALSPSSGFASMSVDDSSYFTDSGTAYIKSSDDSLEEFTYTGKTANSLTGCSGLTKSYSSGSIVYQEEESNANLYDNDLLLPKLGDRMYKKNLVEDGNYYDQTTLDNITKAWLREFKKNHTKISVVVPYSPHFEVGDTVYVTKLALNYFIESISDENGKLTMTLARYPGD